LKAVIIGAGRAGQLMRDAINQVNEIELIGIGDRVSKVSSTVETWQISTQSDLDEIISKYSPDLVCISTPPDSHLEYAKTAMENGCHVLVEKPIALSVKEAEEMKRISEKNDVKLSVIHNHKYFEGFQKAIQLFKDGRIGRAVYIQRSFMLNGDKHRMINNPDFWWHQYPGGVWNDALPHAIYIPYQIVGEMQFVTSDSMKLVDRFPWLVADEVNVLLKSKSGYVNIELSANSKENINTMIIYGTNGVIYSDYNNAEVLKHKGAIKININGLFRKTKSLSTHAIVLQKFVNYILYDEPEPVSWNEAYNTMELTEQTAKYIGKP